MQHIFRKVLSGLLLLTTAAPAYWHTLLSDDFSTPGTWSYAGATNAGGQPLFRHDPTTQRVLAEWDQALCFDASGDPYTILNSSFLRALPRSLNDNQTFRFGVTLRLNTGSVPDTTEFFQIANFGLYNITETGPDRTMTDNWSWNSTILKDASDFLEFNYFINNRSWGFNPNIQPTIGTHIIGLDGDYIVGSSSDAGFWNDTDMGPDHYLPAATALYLEVTYHGAATGAVARRAYAAVYTDPDRTNILVINGVSMHYWTQPVPTEKTFTLTDAGFFNYPTANWGGANGLGNGSFDDFYVDLHVAEGEFFSQHAAQQNVLFSAGAVSGSVYYLESCADLSSGVWTTTAVTVAEGGLVSFTNQPDGSAKYYRVSR